VRLLGRLVLAAAALTVGARGGGMDTMTPLVLAVHDAPVPFMGSDGRVHLVYELWVTNFSSADVIVKGVEVLGDGGVLENLDADAVAGRLQSAGVRESAGTLVKSSQALLFLNVTLEAGAAIPHQLSHRLALHVNAAPPGMQEMSETGGVITVDRKEVALIGPPLRGEGYISADSCCESTRHRRAAMPVNGRVWVAQRFAVDWEQMDSQGRIYVGPQEKLESYAIFGKPVLAVADAVVAAVVDGRPEQTPGKYPANISLDEADGNCVILDLGGGRYAMYAHMQPGSIKVRKGDQVKLGQVIGLVGDSGNSVVPHLHFQVMDAASSLGSNGLPYEIREFQVTGKTGGTKAFDEAEEKGTPLAITALSSVQEVKNAMPLDQLIVSFDTK
jgi:hypothetical protein